MIDSKTDNNDRFSQLPEFILHHIMSFLEFPEELVKMSVLSKKWFSVTASFPILDFNIAYFTERSRLFPLNKRSDFFYKYVEYTTSRFCKQTVTSAHTLVLITDLQTPAQVDIIDRCLQSILKRPVQDLEIGISEEGESSEPMPKYRLPNELLSASFLTSLMLLRCELPSSFMVGVVMFKSLKLLELNKVHIDDEMITRLIASCPVLEKFSIDSCIGFKRFRIYSHQNLLNVEISHSHEVERIDIEAPNLCLLSLYNYSRVAPCLNLASCKKLTKLNCYEYPSSSFDDFSFNFPFVIDFSLKLPNECKNVKLKSSSLRKFRLQSKCELEEIDINIPNLLLFVYADFPLMQDSCISIRDLAQLNAGMECDLMYDVDILWFLKLRRFLVKKNTFSVLKLHLRVSLLDIEELKVIQSSPPYELEHVDLQLHTFKETSVAAYLAVVDAVVWCFRPRSLTLRSKFQHVNSEERIQVVKFTYEKLLQQENEAHSNIHMVVSSFSKDKKRFDDHSLLTESPYGINKITFTKEKVVQEAKVSSRIRLHLMPQ